MIYAAVACLVALFGVLFLGLCLWGLFALLKPRRPGPPAFAPAPTVTPSPATRSLTDEMLSHEYMRRVKLEAEREQTVAVLKNIHAIAKAQIAPITTAQPATINYHPAFVQPAAEPPRPN